MRSIQSHGRLLVIMAVVSIPVGFGMGAGIWLSQESQVSRQETDTQARFRQVGAQAHILSDLVTQEVEALRLQSLALLQNHAAPTGKVLHLMEVEFAPQKAPEIKYLAKNPLWNGNTKIEESYLQNAVKGLRLEEIQKNGSLILRIRRDSIGKGEWLSFAFPSVSEKSAVLVMVDPLLAFPSFQKWVTHSAGGRSRSYLIANDGRVLAHSQKALISADFSNLPIFQNLLRRALQGTLTSGMGDFKGIDHLDVGAAFVRLNPFPVAVVVEEVNSEKLNQPNGVRIAFLGFMALLVLAAVVLSSALFLASYLVKTVTLTVHSESSDFDDSESLSVQEPERTKSKNGFFSGDEMLLLDSIRSSNKGDFDT